MGRASSGGMAIWRGAAFELRLGVEFCVYILLGELDVERVLALCSDGEALCGPMEDKEGLAFYRQVRQALEGQDGRDGRSPIRSPDPT